MGDLEFLFFILVGFYLFECAHWVRHGAVLFVSQFPGFKSGPRYTAVLQNLRGALLPGNLLPTGCTWLTRAWPFSVSPHGLFAYTTASVLPAGRPDATLRCVLYEDIEILEAEGKQLLINKALFCEAGSARQARQLLELLQQWKKLGRKKRTAAIEKALAAAFEVEEIKKRLAECRRQLFLLRVLCLLLLLYLFVFVPIALFGNTGYSIRPQYAVLGYVTILGLAFLEASEAHRVLYPGESRQKLWLMALSPADAMHAADQLAQDVVCAHHPLAVAAAVCSRRQFEEFAGRILRDHRHPLEPIVPPEANEKARAAEEWFRTQLGLALDRFLEAEGLKADKLLEPPARSSAESVAYCPRCQGQFEKAEGNCHGCGCRLEPLTAPGQET